MAIGFWGSSVEILAVLSLLVAWPSGAVQSSFYAKIVWMMVLSSVGASFLGQGLSRLTQKGLGLSIGVFGSVAGSCIGVCLGVLRFDVCFRVFPRDKKVSLFCFGCWFQPMFLEIQTLYQQSFLGRQMLSGGTSLIHFCGVKQQGVPKTSWRWSPFGGQARNHSKIEVSV